MLLVSWNSGADANDVAEQPQSQWRPEKCCHLLQGFWRVERTEWTPPRLKEVEWMRADEATPIQVIEAKIVRDI